jgi:hypothetical protein
MKSQRILASLVAFSACGLTLALAGGNNFDRLTNADRAALQERFTKEIWPLLEQGGRQSCVGCHAGGKGGNALKMSGKADKDFRMLVKEGFFLPDDSGSILTRIMSKNKKQMMPPPGKGDPWTKADIEVLQKFVADLDKKQMK